LSARRLPDQFVTLALAPICLSLSAPSEEAEQCEDHRDAAPKTEVRELG